MNPSLSSASSGDDGGTPPELYPPLPDWQEALVEAIQKRDDAQARQLAERCVHRYGMDTLDSLMARAGGGQDTPEAVRSWLLPLLAQPAVAQPPSLPAPSPLPPAPVALDEAFAPLEVAFPPLTPSPAPPPNDAPSRPSPDPLPLPGNGVEDPFPMEVLEQRAAAPVPTFESEGHSGGSLPPPPSRRVRNDDRRSRDLTPPPISPALEPWLVWLPGVVPPPRSRS